MRRRLTSFPNGFAGTGLFLLRAALTALSFTGDHGQRLYTSHHGLFILLMSAAVMLFLGAITALAATALLVEVLLSCIYEPSFDAMQSGITILLALSVAMLGPGAYSVDGYIWGRKRIVLSAPR